MMLRFRLGALSLALAVALAACGGSGGSKQEATPTVPAATPTTAGPTKAAATPTGVLTAQAVATATPPAGTPTAPASTNAPLPAATGAPGATTTVVVGAVPNAAMQYYDITGTTAADLRAAMDAQGPVDGSGRHNDAFTTWNIDWTWPLNPDGTCVLSGATVTDTITVTFPRWLPPPGAPGPVIERWNTYESALVTHESGHVSFVIATAADVLAAIKGATCATAEAAAQAVVTRIRQHDLDYDAETNHGATQGARFP